MVEILWLGLNKPVGVWSAVAIVCAVKKKPTTVVIDGFAVLKQNKVSSRMPATEFQIEGNCIGEYINIDVPLNVFRQFYSDVELYLHSIMSNTFHRKRFIVYFKLHPTHEITKLRLCDVLPWCKQSKVDEVFDPCGAVQAASVITCFVHCIAVAKIMTGDASQCSFYFTTSADKSVQINARRLNGFAGTAIVGVCIAMPNECLNCCLPASASCKLRMCSRCFRNGRIRVLYCSKACQLADYARHRSACTFDWDSPNWRRACCVPFV
jgi:hypothetical protein